MDGHIVNIEWGGQNFKLLAERALLWLEKSTLILSDVHLGKAHDFQASGIPISGSVHDDDVDRMGRLLEDYKPGRVFVLGDFVHSHRTKLEALTQRFRKMKGNHPAKWTLTTGNHDRSAKEKLLAWGFDEFCDEVHEDGIAFSHGHEESRGLSIVGHVHPVIKIGTGRDRMRLPCFWLGRKAFVIPSFGSFTGGFEITPRRHERVYVVAQDSIVEVPVMR